MKQLQIAQCWRRCSTHITEILSKRHLEKSQVIKATFKIQIPSITSSSNVCETNPEEIFELLSAVDTKKALGFDMIPPKLVKMAASVLCQPLSNAINNYQTAFFQTMLKLPWFRDSTEVLLKIIIYRIFAQLVL